MATALAEAEAEPPPLAKASEFATALAFFPSAVASELAEAEAGGLASCCLKKEPYSL